MGFAEKKVELLKIVADADEEMTGKLIEFAKQLEKKSQRISKEEVEIIKKSRDEFFSSGAQGYSVEEAHAMIRNKNKK